MTRLWQTLWLFISASLLVHAQIDLDDPEVREEIIAQAVEVTPKKQADGTTVFYEPFTRSPYKGTGWAVFYFDDLIKLKALIQIKGGKREGLQTQWHENGIKKAEANWKEGNPDGLVTHWHENGQMKEKGDWKDGKKHGVVTEWYGNGQKLAEGNFKDGKLDGQGTSWYENGEKQSEGYWKDGKLQRGKKWKPNGEVCPITNVNYGNGISVIYNMDGSEKERFIYNDGARIETNEQSNEKTDAGISSEELDKLLENSIGEPPPIPVPLPPSP